MRFYKNIFFPANYNMIIHIFVPKKKDKLLYTNKQSQD